MSADGVWNMSRRHVIVSGFFSLLVGGGCGGTATVDAGVAFDAGAGVDASRDLGMRVDSGGPTDAGPSGAWLSVSGNHVLLPDGHRFHGRGANIQDTRSCDACTYDTAHPEEVERRIDALADDWHANFLRLTLESYSGDNGFRMQWHTLLDDPAYLADIHRMVTHATAKPGVYVLLSIWNDPSLDAMGWPTAVTRDEWRALTMAFLDEPKVLFGLVNEPENNFDGAMDAACWDALNQTAQAIRDVEDMHGAHHHVISVPGTGGWARYLAYYETHPITAGGGGNIAYEVHVYDPQSEFASLLIGPAATLPVIVGEHGPVSGGGSPTMTTADCMALESMAESLEVPWLAWTFHQNCDPNLIVDNSGGGCGVGMALTATPWGQVVKDRLATPW